MKNQTHNDLSFVVRKLDDSVIKPVVNPPTPVQLLTTEAVQEKVGFAVYTSDSVPDEFFLSAFDAVDGTAVQHYQTPEMCDLNGVCTPGSTLIIRQAQENTDLPEGDAVKVGDHSGVYSANRLTWQAEGFTFSVESDALDCDGLVGVAESMRIS